MEVNDYRARVPEILRKKMGRAENREIKDRGSLIAAVSNKFLLHKTSFKVEFSFILSCDCNCPPTWQNVICLQVYTCSIFVNIVRNVIILLYVAKFIA